MIYATPSHTHTNIHNTSGNSLKDVQTMKCHALSWSLFPATTLPTLPGCYSFVDFLVHVYYEMKCYYCLLDLNLVPLPLSVYIFTSADLRLFFLKNSTCLLFYEVSTRPFGQTHYHILTLTPNNTTHMSLLFFATLFCSLPVMNLISCFTPTYLPTYLPTNQPFELAHIHHHHEGLFCNKHTPVLDNTIDLFFAIVVI